MALPSNFSLFVDVDFVKFADYVVGDITDRQQLLDKFSDYEQSLGVIPESDWKEIIEEIEYKKLGAEWLVKHVYNQGREGSCVSNATCAAVMCVAAKQFGHNRVPILSPMSLYKRVASGPNTGSTVKDNVDEAMTNGILPVDNPENRNRFKHVFPATGYRTRLPDGWQETAAKFLIDEVYVCRDYRSVISAQLRGHYVIVGRQGHSILYLRPTYERGRIYNIYLNSWGDDWGFGLGSVRGGFGVDSLDLIHRASNWAVAVRTVNFASEVLL